MKLQAKLNKRERKAQQLIEHYKTCERLAVYLGMPATKVDGKRISVALWKIEQVSHAGATALCNGETYYDHHDKRLAYARYDFGRDENAWSQFTSIMEERVAAVFGGRTPPGLFINGDARGYALKIDPDDAAGKALIDTCNLHADWGSFGILSPEITGD